MASTFDFKAQANPWDEFVGPIHPTATGLAGLSYVGRQFDARTSISDDGSVQFNFLRGPREAAAIDSALADLARRTRASGPGPSSPASPSGSTPAYSYMAPGRGSGVPGALAIVGVGLAALFFLGRRSR